MAKSAVNTNGEVYVTYKWLIATFIASLTIIVVITIAITGSLNKAIDCKVDNTYFAQAMSALNKTDDIIISNQQDIKMKMEVFHDNQIRVMEKLNIQRYIEKNGARK